MRRKKTLLSFAFLILLSIITLWIWLPRSLPDESARLEAEQEIYSLLLADIDGELWIARHTSLGKFDDATSGKNISSWVAGPGTIKQETILDFEDNNRQSYPIKDYLPVEIIQRLINWKNWHISFSRIGFDPHLTQALVVRERYMSCSDAGDCPDGTGELLFLKKMFGKWIIWDELGQWMAEDA